MESPLPYQESGLILWVMDKMASQKDLLLALMFWGWKSVHLISTLLMLLLLMLEQKLLMLKAVGKLVLTLGINRDITYPFLRIFRQALTQMGMVRGIHVPHTHQFWDSLVFTIQESVAQHLTKVEFIYGTLRLKHMSPSAIQMEHKDFNINAAPFGIVN